MSARGVVQQQNICHSMGPLHFWKHYFISPLATPLFYTLVKGRVAASTVIPAPPSTFLTASQGIWSSFTLRFCLEYLFRSPMDFYFSSIDLISIFMLLLLLLVKLGRMVEIFNSENVRPPPLFFFKMVWSGEF